MSAKSKIDWLMGGASWPIVTGCHRVNEMCDHCYAKRFAKRFWKDREFGDVRMHSDKLDLPEKWKSRPRMIFCDAMGDLFHSAVAWDFIVGVWKVMRDHPMHTFIILTKRPDTAMRFINYVLPRHVPEVPLPNVWLGVSAGTQMIANAFVPTLLETNVQKHIISAEPLLEPMHLLPSWTGQAPGFEHHLSWVIVGGENGPSARPMQSSWANNLQVECLHAHIPYFFKGHGEWIEASKFIEWEDTNVKPMQMDSGETMIRVGSKKIPKLLYGKEYHEVPK